MDGIKNRNNIDGLRKINSRSLDIGCNKIHKPRVLPIDGVKKTKAAVYVSSSVTAPSTITPPKVVMSQKRAKRRQYVYPAYRKIHRHAPLVFAALVIFFAFMGGMWVEWRSSDTYAEKVVPVSEGHIVPMEGAVLAASSDTDISNEMLFNTPLDQLQQYFASTQAPDAIAVRAEQLKSYLEKKKSPFVEQSAFIAQQEHWKLILAISYAESTLGKRCYNFNCSGIGGSNIRTYKSTEEWITDFNRLLDKRYKDKTLEQMCGVYVQPCNPNWLLATKQILGELEEEGIE